MSKKDAEASEEASENAPARKRLSPTAKAREPLSPERVRREVWAGTIAMVIGLPLVVLGVMAMKDGVVRAEEAPLRSVLGDQRYEALVAGEGGFPHYLGNDRRVPDFTLEDAEGRAWRMEDQRGKVVVLNFWSITCPPCREEMPSLELLAHMVADRDDVEVVTVSTDEGPEAVREVIEGHTQLKHLFDPESRVVKELFGTELYPETWIIDPRGVVRFRFDGARDWSSPLVLDLIDQFR